MIRGIHHPGITTDDLDRLLPFYTGLLGFQQISGFGWEAGTAMSELAGRITGVANSTARSALLKTGNAFLEIFEFKKPSTGREGPTPLSRPGIAHICFDSDDVIADHERLAHADVQFISAPIDVGPMRLCYCRDPDGNLVELQQITDPDSDIVLRAAQA